MQVILSSFGVVVLSGLHGKLKCKIRMCLKLQFKLAEPKRGKIVCTEKLGARFI